MRTVSTIWWGLDRDPVVTDVPDHGQAAELAASVSKNPGVARVYVQNKGKVTAVYMRGASQPHLLRGVLTAEQLRAVANGRCRLMPYGCDGALHSGGYCGAHNSRVARNGDPGDPVIKRRLRRVTRAPQPLTFHRCQAQVPGGCPFRMHADGLCRGHYSRKAATGSAGTEPVKAGGLWSSPLTEEELAEAVKRAGGDADLIGVTSDGRVVLQPRRKPPSPSPGGGGRRGRPPAFTEEGVEAARAVLAELPEVSATHAAFLLGVSVNTLRRYFPEFRHRSSRKTRA